MALEREQLRKPPGGGGGAGEGRGAGLPRVILESASSYRNHLGNGGKPPPMPQAGRCHNAAPLRLGTMPSPSTCTACQPSLARSVPASLQPVAALGQLPHAQRGVSQQLLGSFLAQRGPAIEVLGGRTILGLQGLGRRLCTCAQGEGRGYMGSNGAGNRSRG